MRPATLLLTGVPQIVELVDLSYNLDLLFDTNDIGTFELRDVSHYTGKRKIALDFRSGFDAFTAQSRLDGYVYVLPNGQQYMLNAKLAKKNMALRRVSGPWRSPSPVERAESRDWDAKAAIAVLPTASGDILERAHAKLDAQLDLLKKQKLILKAQRELLKAKKKLQKEYAKVEVSSVEEPTSSSHNPLPRNPSPSKSKFLERRWRPVNPPGNPPIKTTTTIPTVQTKVKEKPKSLQKEPKTLRKQPKNLQKEPKSLQNEPKSLQKKPKTLQKEAKEMCKRRSRSRTRSRSKSRDRFRERSRSKNRRRSSSKNRRSSSEDRRSRCRSCRSRSGSRRSRSRSRRSRSRSQRSRSRSQRSRSRSRRSRSRSQRSRSRSRRSRSSSRRSCSGSQRSRSKNGWSSKNRRPGSRRSRSHYWRSRSRSRETRKRWSSRTRDWPRSRDYSPLRARLRVTTLRSPEFYWNRPRSRNRVYTRRPHSIGKGSVSSEPYTRQLAIMPAPIQDSQSIVVKRENSADPVIDYITKNTVTNFHESSPRGMRYICAADKDETVSKCTDLCHTNNIDIIAKKLTDEENNKEASIKENRVETSVGMHRIQEIPKSNEKKCDDVVEQDNSELKKPLVDILLGICKDSSLNTDPIGSYYEKDLALQLAGDVNNTLSSGYLDNKPRVSELAIIEETNLNNNNLNLQEISTMDTNTGEDVIPFLNLANIPEVIEINAEYPSQQMHPKILNEDFSIDVDVKPLNDPEKIPQLKEIKEELPSLLKPIEFVVNKDSNIGEGVKPVTQLEEIPGEVEIKKNPLLPKRPKFVIIIRQLMKEMGASFRKVKDDFKKMSFQGKFKYVLRVILREIVLGKGRMNKSEILRSFRGKYPKEQDDEFARRVVEDIQAGKYGNLGPSDDELSNDHVGDDLLLVENEPETIVISDSDDESGMSPKTNMQTRRRLAWAEWARARGLTPKKPPKVFAQYLTMPRVLVPYPTSMGPLQDKENMHEATEVNIENNDIVPEFTDTEVENLLKCMEMGEPGTADPRDGTETPHVTGITIVTSLSELFSLKYGKQIPLVEEKKIKTEHNPLTEEYMNDDAQYYNPYKE